MYVLMQQGEISATKIKCIEEKTALANFLGVHRNTIYHNFEGKNSNEWQYKDYTIYYVEDYTPKTKKTGFTSTARANKTYEDTRY